MRRFSRATLCIVFVLAMAFGSGGGVAGDAAEDLADLRAAAEQGFADAQYNLGAMYFTGKGVAEDFGEAVKWYRLATEQGFAGAQNDLGVMYDNGKGVPEDFVLAHMWSNLAAAQGDANATKNRGMVAKRMTGAQIAEAQRLAREWTPKFTPNSDWVVLPAKPE